MAANATTDVRKLSVPAGYGDLPEGWSWAPLNDLCQGIYDCPHSTPQLTVTGPYVARTQDVSSGVFRTEKAARVSEETYIERTRRALPSRGDLLYSREGTYFGIAAEVPKNTQVCLGQRMVLIRPDCERVDFRFLRYWLNSPLMAAHAHGFRDGSVAERLNLPTIRALPILVPPAFEQRAIADALGVLDDKIAVNERIVGYLDQLTHGLFAATFMRHAGEQLPDGWRFGRLSDLCSTQYGYTASANVAPVGPKLLRVKDINKRNWIEWDDVPYCEIPDHDREKYSLSTGDILVARMADPGKSAIIEESVDAVFASYLVRLATESIAHAYFVWGFLKSASYAQYAESSRSGSVQSNMNAKVITAVELDIPPAQLMRDHLQRISLMRRKLVATLQESRALAALRDTLLPQLMSGRLRVRDAERIVEDAL